MSGDTVTLDPVAAGLALGASFAVAALLMGVIAWLSGTWTGAVESLGNLYVGYAPTPSGSVIGAVWGAFDGFVSGAVVAWLYNRIAERRAT